MTFDQQLRDLLTRKAARGRAPTFEELHKLFEPLRDGYYALHIPVFSTEQQAQLRRLCTPREQLRPLCAAYVISFRAAPEVAKAVEVPDGMMQGLLDKDQHFGRLQSLNGSLLRLVKDHKLVLSYQLGLAVDQVEAAFQEMLAEAPDDATRVRMRSAYGDLQQQGEAQADRILTQRRNAGRRGQADKAALAALDQEKIRSERKSRLLASDAKPAMKADAKADAKSNKGIVH